ncbi:MAG TPA: phosphoglycerate kinase, partial [Salinimicrobium sp.]|nr:phosphoglycerate kinase [Salinimicrobium sp.]
MKTINDFNFKDKKALVRVDFNVPLNKNLEVADASRIEAAKPTVQKILKDGGSAILMSHLGRPNGREQKFSLENIVDTVSEILGVPVKFVPDCIGEKVTKASENLKPGEVLLLENLRFHPEEKQGDEDFAKALASLGDIYVNDAFGTAHRAHASTTVVAKYFEDKCFGFLLAKEIESLEKVMGNSKKPVTAILGGAKVSTKITVIENILAKIDHLILGGGMTYTFIKARGGKIGDSLVEDDKQDLALKILEMAKKEDVKVHLPVDSVVADSFSETANTKVMPVNEIEDG